MENEKIFSALIGLAGAVSTNEKTDETDSVVARAVLESDNDAVIDKIHREKYKISPGCETCKMPCGNTSDYDMKRFFEADSQALLFKESVAKRLKEIAGEYEEGRISALPDKFYKALSFLGYGLEADAYSRLLEEL